MLTKTAKPIDPRILKARAQLIMSHPFYGALCLRLKIVENPREKTGSTDGKAIYYNPKFLDTLTEEQIKGFIVHEVDHVAKKHIFRRKSRDLKLYNVACDYQVNSDLLRAGFKLPNDVLVDSQYDGLYVEEIYKLLDDKQKKKQQQKQQQQQQEQDGEGAGSSSGGDNDENKDDKQDDGEGDDDTDDNQDTEDTDSNAADPEKDGERQDGQGDGEPDGEDDEETDDESSGKGQGDDDTEEQDGEGDNWTECPDPGGCGGVRDAAPTEAEAAELEADWDINIRQAINVAIRQAGSLPGYLEGIAEEIKNPKEDWRSILRRFVDPSTRKDFSWKRPSRRHPNAGYILPGQIADGVSHLGILYDASGSLCDPETQAQFRGEIQDALDNGAVDRVTIAYHDTEVYASDSFTAGEQIVFRAPRGGGTYFDPGFKWFGENAADVSGVVHFTDMEAGDWDSLETPDYPVLFAAFGDPRSTRQYKPPFGEVIELTPY